VDTLLNTEEAAQQLRVSVSTLRKRIRKGEIRALLAGKQFRIPESALEEYLAPAPVDLPTSKVKK
jgi:excisionase family DNA binding protein